MLIALELMISVVNMFDGNIRLNINLKIPLEKKIQIKEMSNECLSSTNNRIEIRNCENPKRFICEKSKLKWYIIKLIIKKLKLN